MHLIYAAMLAGVLMDVAIKAVSPEVGTWTLVAWRWIIALLLLGPMLVWRLDPALWRPFDRVHLWRAGLNGVGVFCLFHALQVLPLSVTVTIFFAEPLFTTLFARFVGQERVQASDWLISVLGFFGVAVVVADAHRFTGAEHWVSVDALLAVLGAAAFGMTSVVTRRYGGGHSSLALTFWMAVISATVGSAMAGPSLLEIESRDFQLVALAALLGTAFALLWVSGLKRMSASSAAAGRYLTLPLGHLCGYLFFSEVPGRGTLFGSCVVLLVIGVLMRPSVRRRIDLAFTR